MKKWWYIIILILCVVAGICVGSYIYNSSNKEENTDLSETNTYEASKTSTNSTNTSSNTDNSSNENNSSEEKTEKQLSSFTTTIYTKEEERQNNISIACSTLNGTTVENGETFSFTDTLGKATTSKGYEKADVYIDGNVTQGLGGGICQVSTTLYNAIKTISNLDVTERHEHSNEVPYAEKGKDAAVAYGSYDFKFVNNTGNTIKIESNSTKNKVNVKIYELK